MIGEGDQAGESKNVLDLIHLGFVGQLGRERRRPIGALEINRGVGFLALLIQSGLQHRAFLGQQGEEVEAFLGAIRVPVK